MSKRESWKEKTNRAAANGESRCVGAMRVVLSEGRLHLLAQGAIKFVLWESAPRAKSGRQVAVEIYIVNA